MFFCIIDLYVITYVQDNYINWVIYKYFSYKVYLEIFYQDVIQCMKGFVNDAYTVVWQKDNILKRFMCLLFI